MSANRAWERDIPPGRLVGRGHPAGDFLEAYDWDLLTREPGLVRVEAHLPQHVRNPRGQLFGGFTPTYVDMICLFTVRTLRPREPQLWLATTHMSVDYFEPVLGPRFVVEGRVEKSRGRSHHIATRFFTGEGFDQLAVFSMTSMREVVVEPPGE